MNTSSNGVYGERASRDIYDRGSVRALRHCTAYFAAEGRARIWTGAIVIGQVALFFGVAAICDTVVARMRLPIPGNALGIAVVFTLLRCGLLRLVWLEAGATLLVRHLSLFFVPIGVATIATLPSLMPIVLPLAVALVASTTLGIGAAGVAVERVTSAGGAAGARSREHRS